MNNNKILLFFLVAFSSCVDMKKELNDEFLDKLLFDSITDIEAEFINIDKFIINAAMDLKLFNNLLIVEDFIQQPHCFFVVDLSQNEVIATFPNKGKGPGEIINPSMNPYITDVGTLQLFDPNTRRICEYSLDLTNLGKVISEIKLPQVLYKDNGFILECFHIDNSFIAIGNGNPFFSKYRFLHLNEDNNHSFTGEIEKIPSHINNETFQKIMMYVRRVEIKPDKSKILFVSYIGGRMEIFENMNTKEGIQNTISKNFSPYIFTEDEYNVVWNDDTIIGFEDIFVTNDYIYALYNGCKGDEYEYPSTIKVFNWDGLPVRQFNLNTNLRSIAVDEENNCIYGIFYTNSDTGLARFYFN